MIRSINLESVKKYGKYFLALEDDGDSPKVKTKSMSVKVNNTKTDFSQGAGDIEDDPIETDTPDSGNPSGGDDVDSPDTGDDTDYTDNDETDVEDTTGEEGDEENDDGDSNDPIEPDTGGDTDFTDDGDTDMDGSDNDSGDDSVDSDSDSSEDKKGSGVDYDSTRRYVLLQNFISLINSLSNFIIKLENVMGDDTDINKIIKTSVNKFREVKELCHDYLIMKFELNSYVQSLLFYQNMIVIIQSIFNLLEETGALTDKS
jgi:shell matrix protein|nr:MAG TPA: hypothetical protein [Caudoviricetes sp.]